MELFEQIRCEYEHGGGTIRGIAKKLGIHRRLVREAVLSAVPVERKTPVRERPKLEPAKAFVEAILEADRKAPRKQRHTAHRIWCRIRVEMPGMQIGESTIRRYVRERKMELNSSARKCSFRSLTDGVKKHKWTGMKPTRISAESESWPTYFACAAWPVEEHSIARSRTPVNKRFWKRMNERLSISVEYLQS